VGYYTEHLLHHLAAEGPRDEIIVISNRPVETTRPLPSHVRVVTSRWRLPRIAWMQTQAPRLLKKLQPDVVHFTNGIMPLASPVPAVVTIHDMSLTLFPATILRAGCCSIGRSFPPPVGRRIITVSESAKGDIRSHGLSADRARVLKRRRRRSGPSNDLGELTVCAASTGCPIGSFSTSGRLSRKNLPKLIEAFARRRRQGDLTHQLVCAGPYGWLSRDIDALIDRLQVNDSVLFTGYVPFDDLAALYNLAEMFVFPSIYEGFGLPVIEAMACGTPVITGRIAALDEVAAAPSSTSRR
jgi:glycosyltransferase involved in cell wall biosynthesis